MKTKPKAIKSDTQGWIDVIKRTGEENRHGSNTKSVPSTRKIVINTCYGGFSLSHEAVMRYADLKGITLYAYSQAPKADGHLDFKRYLPYDPEKDSGWFVMYSTQPLNKDGTLKAKRHFSTYDLKRDDPALVKVVEELGNKANGDCAKLKVVEIPNDVDWQIGEYDGMEHVEEKHRSWC